MQKEEILLNQVSMIDEEVTFDRCPCHEKDVQLNERIIQDDPTGTATDGIDRSGQQKVLSDWKFNTGNETIDDEKESIDLSLYVTPFEVV